MTGRPGASRAFRGCASNVSDHIPGGKYVEGPGFRVEQEGSYKTSYLKIPKK